LSGSKSRRKNGAGGQDMARKVNKSKGWHRFAWAAKTDEEKDEAEKKKKCKYCGSEDRDYHLIYCPHADATKF